MRIATMATGARTAVLAAGAAVLLVACGADDAGSEATAAPEETAQEPTEAPAEAGTDEATSGVETEEEAPEAAAASPDLALGDTPLGEVLVDGEGMTLYLFTEDPPGESVCTGECLTAWPPLLIEDDPTVGDGVDPALVGTITREDGTVQVTYGDAPLYTWISDQQPGDVTGQGVEDVWYVVAADGSAVTDDADEEPARDPAY